MTADLTHDWQVLDGVIAGEVVRAGSPAYDDPWHQPFNARFHDVRPQAVVRCAAAEDVVEAIAFVARHGLERAVRSGGHCFAGRSSTRGAVIDVTPMAAVTAAGGVATVGAGARLGGVYEALQDHGLTIPGGTCPQVGIAGLALGGGLGILGRTHGVLSDHLVGAQIVLADGRILDCDGHHDADLFWALRGAGAGNFGVVTSLAFRTVPAPRATSFHVAWGHTAAARAIEAWQRWAPSGPDELAASLKVTTTGDVAEPPSVDVYGTLHLGTESDATELVERLVARVGSEPIAESCHEMSAPETRRFWADLGAVDGGADPAPDPSSSPHPRLYAKSEYFRRPLPTVAVAALVEAFSRGRTAGESRELDFMPWGGAYNRVPPDATAFVHRDELFQLKHAAVVDPSSPTRNEPAAQRWVAGSWATVHPWASGRVFPNFADPDLEDWNHACFGTNYERLVRVKRRYDPTNSFRFPQSLPLG